MACSRSMILEDNFLCSICLDVFTRPVSIPCGHNFCFDCIAHHWNNNAPIFQCPLCMETFPIRPMLRVNIFIAEMAEKFKNSATKNSSDRSDKPGNEGVLCNLCTGSKVAAFKSCLVCLMSFCETHLEPHQTVSALKKHKLIKPTENLESWICKAHDQHLELFCRKDHQFVCNICKDTDHKNHKVVSLEEEIEIRKTEQEAQQREMDLMIQTRHQKIQEFRHSIETSRSHARKVLTHSRHVMNAVVDYIKRSQAELTEVIELRQKKTETEAEGFIRDLEEEITQIAQRNRQLSGSVNNDPVTNLQNLFKVTVPPIQVRDWSDVSLEREQFNVQEAAAQFESTVTAEIRKLCDPDLKEMQKYAVDLTLDPDTANSHLIVSEDGKQVVHVDRRRFLPSKPERFDQVLNVLAKEGFSTGKFYYEVQVKDKTQWDLGVANQSINRKGDVRLSPKNGYWTIWLRKEREFTANAGPAVSFHVRGMPEKIGVFVDYEGGLVSFYDVDARAQIFSFSGCDFTEKLFPFFSPCTNDGGKNAAPLIITPVKYKI
ncbi:E3 ubiquitin-protein ligase TRIM21-like [Sphaeramia orbicularis]|uniref:E3 ubiquitin-protein ligase TRIM21-like n=1 Tax=Sphaeramia orbicularis TaxID=375764 RepID=A0A673BG64_9TELE|nr:E3 ubiquitin-protein ligase TRIM21-like [Sphaeramia orbicularis]